MIKYYFIVVLIVFALFLYNSIKFRINEGKKLDEKLRKEFGVYSEKKYNAEEMEKLLYFFKKKSEKRFAIDDITWNDLDMDKVFMALNNTRSSVGEEYFYKTLRIPEFNNDVLEKREKFVEYFYNNPEAAVKLQKIFINLGYTKKFSMAQFVDELKDMKTQKNLPHIISLIMFFVSFSLLFVNSVIGIVAFITVLVINIGTYYKAMAEVDSYFKSFKYLIDMINCSKKLVKLEDEGIKEYTETLGKNINNLSKVTKGSFLVSINGSSGSIMEVIMEYIRMFTHIDLIKFNSMIVSVNKYAEDINEMFEILGLIETEIAIASFRKSKESYCKPEFCNMKEIETENIYHPLISNPVSNDFCNKKSVLITGSNASGKSTFLKTIAINSIFAQTINTCLAEKFRTNFYKIYTSMALRDNLNENESYFMVEIKSLKRIFDAIEDENPVICFVDEVLRGTNTIERIAASSYLLDYISKKNVLCFTATHDIELSEILKNSYENYHFTEIVENDDVKFSFKILKGPADSRNAIKLLGIIGFENEIISNADLMAGNFMESGIWKFA